MPIGSLPDVPDPTKIAKSGAEVMKAVAQGGVGVSMDVADGIRQSLLQTVEGGAGVIDQGVKGVIGIVKQDVETGRTTMNRMRGEIDRVCNSVLSQVDQSIGGEVVRKFKSEVEKQLR